MTTRLDRDQPFIVTLECSSCNTTTDVKTKVVPHPRDQAFDVVCGNCQKPGLPKVATLRHLRKSWLFIISTAVHNLSLLNDGKRYFKITSEICEYLKLHWDALCTGRNLHKTLSNTISSIITTNDYAFESAAHGSGMWGCSDWKEGPKKRRRERLRPSSKAESKRSRLNRILADEQGPFVNVVAAPAFGGQVYLRRVYLRSGPRVRELGPLQVSSFATVLDLRLQVTRVYGANANQLCKANGQHPQGVPICASQNTMLAAKFFRSVTDLIVVQP